MIRNASAAVTIVAAFIAVCGAAALQPAVMGIAGAIAALAATVWGFFGFVDACERRRRNTEFEHARQAATEFFQLRERVWADRLADEPDLPHVSVDHGRAVWPFEIGAVE